MRHYEDLHVGLVACGAAHLDVEDLRSRAGCLHGVEDLVHDARVEEVAGKVQLHASGGLAHVVGPVEAQRLVLLPGSFCVCALVHAPKLVDVLVVPGQLPALRDDGPADGRRQRLRVALAQREGGARGREGGEEGQEAVAKVLGGLPGQLGGQVVHRMEEHAGLIEAVGGLLCQRVEDEEGLLNARELPRGHGTVGIAGDVANAKELVIAADDVPVQVVEGEEPREASIPVHAVNDDGAEGQDGVLEHRLVAGGL
mmetsp:Transcript_57367/g.170705  ORF Transcript_57367/g.170705 Transcript_57367/m.170705 type:complete len:255 (-) Transcript_57367:843-1607(-)